MNANALRLTELSMAFGNKTVLTGINLSLARRDRLVIVGPSGSGKTTLLRLIAGLEAPTGGEIDIAELIEDDGILKFAGGRISRSRESDGTRMGAAQGEGDSLCGSRVCDFFGLARPERALGVDVERHDHVISDGHLGLHCAGDPRCEAGRSVAIIPTYKGNKNKKRTFAF